MFAWMPAQVIVQGRFVVLGYSSETMQETFRVSGNGNMQLQFNALAWGGGSSVHTGCLIVLLHVCTVIEPGSKGAVTVQQRHYALP